MDNDEKILNVLKALQADVTDVKQGQKEQGSAIARLEEGQARVEKRLDTIETNMVTKRDLEAKCYVPDKIDSEQREKVRTHDKQA